MQMSDSYLSDLPRERGEGEGKKVQIRFASQPTRFLDTRHTYICYITRFNSAIACVNRMPCDRGPRCVNVSFYERDR